MKKTNSCTHYIENHKAQFNKYWCGCSFTYWLLLDTAGYACYKKKKRKKHVTLFDSTYSSSGVPCLHWISLSCLFYLCILAQFTYLSGKEMSSHADASYGSARVHNVSDCARLCVTNTDFTCNGFDYCTDDSSATCRLSKNHIGDEGSTVVTSTCDHFSSMSCTYVVFENCISYHVLFYFCNILNWSERNETVNSL